MTTPVWCLLGFVAWTLLLLFSIGAARVAQILSGKVRPSEFTSGVPHGSDRYWRLNRAHLNCLENLPLFAAVILTGAMVGADAPALDRLSVVYLASRIGQSVTHIASGSDRAVTLRFAFFVAQQVCLVGIMLLIIPTRAA